VSRHPLRWGVLGYVALLVAVPVGSVFYRAFEHGFVAAWNSVTTHDGLHALLVTLVVVAIAVPADAVFGVGVALVVTRHRFPGVWLLDVLVDIPLAISPVVVGLALVLVYGQGGWFGRTLAGLGVQVIFSLPGIVMACAAVALPYVVRAVLPVLEEIGTEQEQAASTLGAGPVATFRRVTLPSIRGGLAYGVTLTTARVLGEFGAVAIVSGSIEGKTQTLTLFIQDSVNNLSPVGAYTGAVILAVIAFCVLGVLGTDPKKKRWSWRSVFEPSPNALEESLLSTTSPSMSTPDR
jgi:sulfate/thiosulfate transport system permease protein